MEYVIQLFKLILVLSLFIFAAYAVAKHMKKKQLTKVSPNRLIQVIDGVQVGMKEEVVLMKIGKEYILLSLSSGHLLALKQDEIVAPEKEFSAMLEQGKESIPLTEMVKNLKSGVLKK